MCLHISLCASCCQLGSWLEATLTSLEGAKHMLEVMPPHACTPARWLAHARHKCACVQAYFRLGLDDRVDNFVIYNIRHSVIPVTPNPRVATNAGALHKRLACDVPYPTHSNYSVFRAPPWQVACTHLPICMLNRAAPCVYGARCGS